jgi:hypothetical protein
MEEIVGVIWVVFMIVAAINAVIKKKKQQEQAQASPAASNQAYAAREEDIRAFLGEIGGRAKSEAQPPTPAPPPQAAQPSSSQQEQRSERSLWDERRDALAKATDRRRKGHSSAPLPEKASAKVARAAPSRSVWDEADDASQVAELSAEHDPVAALTERLSPIQRAIIWREILDTPPGLRAGAFTRE